MSEELDKALETAIRAKTNAYAPYSKFHVGAALQAGGNLIPGCNVENASYGAAICAERTAIVSAVAAGHTDFDFIVVATDDDPPAVPCALCLQVMAEFCPPDFSIHLANRNGIQRSLVLKDLLPEPFVLKDAGREGRVAPPT